MIRKSSYSKINCQHNGFITYNDPKYTNTYQSNILHRNTYCNVIYYELLLYCSFGYFVLFSFYQRNVHLFNLFLAHRTPTTAGVVFSCYQSLSLVTYPIGNPSVDPSQKPRFWCSWVLHLVHWVKGRHRIAPFSRVLRLKSSRISKRTCAREAEAVDIQHPQPLSANTNCKHETKTITETSLRFSRNIDRWRYYSLQAPRNVMQKEGNEKIN